MGVIKKSIVRAGFSKDYREWHISRHDVFGERFRNMWISNRSEEPEEFAITDGEVEDPLQLDDDDGELELMTI